MLKCAKCGILKIDSDFRRRAKSNNGRSSRCRDCLKASDRLIYQQKPLRRQQIVEGQKRQIQKNYAYIFEYLSNEECVDCGEADPRVLQFDHRDPVEKCFTIMDGCRSHSLESIKMEIAKCDTRCANCHVRRTASQAGSWRSKWLESSAD